MIVQTQKVSSSEAEKPHEYWPAATQRLSLAIWRMSSLPPSEAQKFRPGGSVVRLSAGSGSWKSSPRTVIVLVISSKPALSCDEVHEHLLEFSVENWQAVKKGEGILDVQRRISNGEMVSKRAMETLMKLSLMV